MNEFFSQLRYRHQLHSGIKNNFILALFYQPYQQNHLSQFTPELCSCWNYFPTWTYAKQWMDTSLWVSWIFSSNIKWTFCTHLKETISFAHLVLIPKPLLSQHGELIYVSLKIWWIIWRDAFVRCLVRL